MANQSSFLAGLFAGQNSHETSVKVDPVYVLMCDGNTTDAYLLAQIVYWHRPAKNGQSKLRVQKNGHYWIAKTAQEWENELAVKERTIRDAVKRLEALKLIVKLVSRFDGKVSTLIRLDTQEFEKQYLASQQSRIDGLRQFELTDYVNSYTETTTETTKDSPATSAGATPETSEPSVSPDETPPADNDTWLMDLLSTEDDLAKRLKVAQDITFPPRPTETHHNGKFTPGLTKTEWFIRLEQIIKAFTDAAGFKIRETSNWLVKETDYDIPDLLSMWDYIQHVHAFNSLPYAVKGKGKGIAWAFSEWQQSQPAPPPPPPVVPMVSSAEKARILADIKARKNGHLPTPDFSFGEND